jgi:archaellum component FlaC
VNVRTTQVPGELAQYNGWTGPELLGLVGRLETENKRLKTLLTRAADALEPLNEVYPQKKRSDLIAELRKAAE